jgi:hypothetical protein
MFQHQSSTLNFAIEQVGTSVDVAGCFGGQIDSNLCGNADSPEIILFYDQQIHNYFTNYHTPTCFDTIVSSSDSL